MELAGLEPAASWVRCGNASARASGVFGSTERRRQLSSFTAGARIAIDYWGLRSIRALEAAYCPFISAAAIVPVTAATVIRSRS